MKTVSYSMITNGYLINDEVAMFMRTHNFKYIQNCINPATSNTIKDTSVPS